MKIILAGDMLFSSRNLANRLDKKLVEKLRAADAVFANAEFTTPEENRPVAAGRGYVTAVRPGILKEFNDLNIKLISMANNHSGDFGILGILDSLKSAQEHDLIVGGLAKSLDEARLPSFYDTSDGRIGFVTATATRGDLFAASNSGNGVPARPGVNPLRWYEEYQVNEQQFDQLNEISNELGLSGSNQHGRNVEGFDTPDNETLVFGSLFEKNLTFKKAKKTEFRTEVDANDLNAIVDSIKDAKKRSDFVFLNIHTHEGVNGDWYEDQPADFVVQTAHAAIDAGADIVIGHGAHFIRGAELYKDKWIFYNLGSLIMEFEAGNSIIPPEMYQAYGLDGHSKPSQLHHQRAVDEKGNFKGFSGDKKFSQNIILELEINDDRRLTTLNVIPLDLGMTRDNALKRGLPIIPSENEATLVMNRLNEISKRFNTSFEYDKKRNIFSI
ncbi:CapA family protein [Leuconostoc suionicum]|uniref:CapA family protein n=1 Tax=Leuconostoc suionicum TaxID=1511761 RepID=UPI0024AD846E|nr:CapA family protein [Leuconostoc suionicum]MDI6498723.1 CapA family protein [Leuconostoc suionicum]MDI6500777.1 CapA family protein [Leuconostoc suionicum]MDI6502931.1 CapA family protein [Leuconostoc suionicum]MDI6665800.1 CapA family protein [Leuconostoc suionicum]